jgi:hypothetical protein
MLGPSGMSMMFSKTSSNLNNIETGYLYHYTFVLLVGSTLLLGVKQFWLIFNASADYRIVIIFVRCRKECKLNRLVHDYLCLYTKWLTDCVKQAHRDLSMLYVNIIFTRY